jgi:hypothetical protein
MAPNIACRDVIGPCGSLSLWGHLERYFWGVCYTGGFGRDDEMRLMSVLCVRRRRWVMRASKSDGSLGSETCSRSVLKCSVNVWTLIAHPAPAPPRARARARKHAKPVTGLGRATCNQDPRTSSKARNRPQSTRPAATLCLYSPPSRRAARPTYQPSPHLPRTYVASCAGNLTRYGRSQHKQSGLI